MAPIPIRDGVLQRRTEERGRRGLGQPLQCVGNKGVWIACAALGNHRHGNLSEEERRLHEFRNGGAKRLERGTMRHTAGRKAVPEDRENRVSLWCGRSAGARVVRAFERGREIRRERTGERSLPNPLRLLLRALWRHRVRLAEGGKLAPGPAVPLVGQ